MSRGGRAPCSRSVGPRVPFFAAPVCCEAVELLDSLRIERNNPHVRKEALRPRKPFLGAKNFLSRQDVHAAQPETFGDGQRHVHVHVEADAQRSRPRAFSLLTSGESATGCRSNSTWCS